MRTRCLAFVDDLHAEINALLRAGFDLHGVAARTERLQDAAFELENNLHGFPVLELVVDVGREDDFVFLDEEPRSLETDEQVFGCDDLRLGLTDLGAGPERPGLDLPGCQAIG